MYPSSFFPLPRIVHPRGKESPRTLSVMPHDRQTTMLRRAILLSGVWSSSKVG